MLLTMPRESGKVHVVRVRRSHVDKRGRVRDYESVYLRRTFRDGARVRNETVANLSMLPAATITAIEASLKGQSAGINRHEEGDESALHRRSSEPRWPRTMR